VLLDTIGILRAHLVRTERNKATHQQHPASSRPTPSTAHLAAPPTSTSGPAHTSGSSCAPASSRHKRSLRIDSVDRVRHLTQATYDGSEPTPQSDHAVPAHRTDNVPLRGSIVDSVVADGEKPPTAAHMLARSTVHIAGLCALGVVQSAVGSSRCILLLF
jgi:hypothetical protein